MTQDASEEQTLYGITADNREGGTLAPTKLEKRDTLCRALPWTKRVMAKTLRTMPVTGKGTTNGFLCTRMTRKTMNVLF